MRTAVACERISKIKCHHTGEAPCRSCSRSGNPGTCVLTATVTTSRSVRASRKRQSSSTPARTTPKPGTSSTVAQTDLKNISISVHYNSIDTSLFTRAIAVFRSQFPEYAFLSPADLEPVPDDISDDDKVKLICILAVSCRYLGEDADSRRSEHAALVTQELQCRVTAPPTLSIIQCFLIAALYEWGEGIGYSAWMHAGIAARMAQVYRAMKVDAQSRPDPRSTSIPSQPTLTEVEVRTMWTYFSVDKLLSCGKQRPAMMKMEDMDVRIPQSEEDFVFGTEPRVSLRQQISTSGFYFCILLRGLDIWHKIHSWIVEGGRRQPKMSDPEHYPWKETSQWAKLKVQLDRWREDQDPRMRYPETKIATHAHFRQGEVFAYINLLYYLNVTFCCREYLPLLPIGEKGPRGPIDPPLFPEHAAPPGWWQRNAEELFNAAAQMSYIMRDLNSLRVCDISITLHTPFTGLCVFSAALLNGYAVAFPNFVGPQEQALRKQLATENLDDLEKISKLWKLGEEWLQVIRTAENLYDRVKNNQASSRRDDYIDLERSVHYAPIGGMYGDRLGGQPRHLGSISIRALTTPTRNQHHTTNATLEMEPDIQQTRLNDQAANAFAGFDADAASDDWRLWSFWDDPHLLSWDATTMGV
ncbi:hypothetical protein F5Y18DRAFT_419124 [Xylariaceae sp. FL1019]|nr:hypothetical protein F5Y18DRAFT_419124 [Xylariaceae sp. FL1019]